MTAPDPFPLRTQRLVLRRLVPADAAALARYRGLPAVARYQSWDTFTPADAERLVADQEVVTPDTPGMWLQLGIAAAATLVGDLGLHTRADDPRQVEVGITLDPAHQGLGYATEALGAVLGYVFGTLGKHRATATTDAANAPAAALFARLGFRREGHFLRNVWFKGAWGDEFLFALLREEWAARQEVRAVDDRLAEAPRA
ncbi:MAG TPA: GNAT family protein [Urbifossiella sp.]|nr:GNAT family protein [Urbifossiella sp.]